MTRLRSQPELRCFKNVILVSSVEDRYVPHHSARVQLCAEVRCTTPVEAEPCTAEQCGRPSATSFICHVHQSMCNASPRIRHTPCMHAGEYCRQAVHDTRYGSAFISMVHNLMSALAETNLVHVEVHFGESAYRIMFF